MKRGERETTGYEPFDLGRRGESSFVCHLLGQTALRHGVCSPPQALSIPNVFCFADCCAGQHFEQESGHGHHAFCLKPQGLALVIISPRAGLLQERFRMVVRPPLSDSTSSSECSARSYPFWKWIEEATLDVMGVNHKSTQWQPEQPP